MLEPLLDDLVELLEGVPIGEYLVQQDDTRRILWRLTDGEPPDGALEPAEDWAIRYDCLTFSTTR
jgi:hypothetical protein